MRWGLLTGQDLAAASFFAAKLLLPPPIREQGPLYCAGASMTAPPIHTAQPLRHDALTHAKRSTLLLGAHGEGAHLDLGSVVLCGLLGSSERDADGVSVPGGCRSSAGVHHCKRHTEGTTIVQARDLESDELVILSCNGMSVAGEGARSSVSLVLGAIEGRPRSIIASDRMSGFARWVAPVLAELCDGRGLAPLWEFLGEVELNTAGARSYALIGDPARRLDAQPRLDAGPMTIDAPGGAFELGTLAEADVIASDAAVGLVRGTRWVGLRTTQPVTVSLRDASDELARAERWVAALRERRELALHLEHALRAHLDGSSSADLGLGDGQDPDVAMGSLTDARARIDQGLRRSTRELGIAFNERVFAPGAAMGLRALAQAIESWDEALAQLCRSHVGLEDLFFSIASGVARGRRQHTRARCRRCDNLILRTDGRLMGEAAPALHLFECPACSICELCPAEGPRLQVTVDAPLVPGSTSRIEVARPTPEDPPLHGWVLVEVKDKARGRHLLRDLSFVRGSSHQVTLTIPDDLPYDIHSVSAMEVSGLRLSWARCRVLTRLAPRSRYDVDVV